MRENMAEVVRIYTGDPSEKVDGFFDALSNNTKTFSLYIGGHEIPPHYIRRLQDNITITDLTLDNAKINDEGLEELATYLRNNVTITDIKLRGITSKKGVLATALRGCSKLEELEISASTLDNNDACALTEALKNCPNLKRLKLDNNCIESKGLKALTDVLMRNPNLIEVKFGGNLEGAVGLTALRSLVATNLNILFCDIGGLEELLEHRKETARGLAKQWKKHKENNEPLQGDLGEFRKYAGAIKHYLVSLDRPDLGKSFDRDLEAVGGKGLKYICIGAALGLVTSVGLSYALRSSAYSTPTAAFCATVTLTGAVVGYCLSGRGGESQGLRLS